MTLRVDTVMPSLLVILPFLSAVRATGDRLIIQDPVATDQSRQILAEEFVKERPPGPHKKPPKQHYRATAGSKSGPQGAGAETHLGMTIWRLRVATTDSEGARLLVQDRDGDSSWVAERVDADAPLAVGDRVRISFEAASAGYLYVIDREQYADGTFGEPYLIFPTSRTRGGDNRVVGGRLVDVPDQADRPNYFSVRRSRPDQVAESLTVIVAPQPIADLVAASEPRVVPVADVMRWQQEWGGPVEKFALEGGALRRWTSPEQSASADRARLLTQEDPPPQTVFRMKSARGRPMLVNVLLSYGAGQPQP